MPLLVLGGENGAVSHPTNVLVSDGEEVCLQISASVVSCCRKTGGSSTSLRGKCHLWAGVVANVDVFYRSRVGEGKHTWTISDYTSKFTVQLEHRGGGSIGGGVVESIQVCARCQERTWVFRKPLAILLIGEVSNKDSEKDRAVIEM